MNSKSWSDKWDDQTEHPLCIDRKCNGRGAGDVSGRLTCCTCGNQWFEERADLLDQAKRAIKERLARGRGRGL